MGPFGTLNHFDFRGGTRISIWVCPAGPSDFKIPHLDILMPEMDGSQVLNKIRELERQKKIPDKLKVKIIMVSGVTQKEMVMACLRDGCDDFLVKPLETRLLFNKIRNFGLLPEEN